MGRDCCVIGCSTARRKHKYVIRKTKFKVPPQGTEKFEEWMNHLEPYKRPTHKKRVFAYVCEDHFEEEFLIRTPLQPTLVDGKKMSVPRKVVRLAPNGVPTKFQCSMKVTNSSESPIDDEVLLPNEDDEEMLSYTPELEDPFSSNDDDDDDEENNDLGSLKLEIAEHGMQVNKTYNLDNLIEDWNSHESSNKAQIWGFVRAPGVGLQFMCYSYLEPLNWRGVLVRSDMTMQAMVLGNLVNYRIKNARATGLHDVLSALKEVSELEVCQGGTKETRCPIGLYTKNPKEKRNRCEECLNNKIYRLRCLNVANKDQADILKREIIQANKKIEALQDSVEELQRLLERREEL